MELLGRFAVVKFVTKLNTSENVVHTKEKLMHGSKVSEVIHHLTESTKDYQIE